MDIRWFQDFLTLAEVRNFTKAAEIRNLSQAAFSRRIQGLEQWLDAKLIDRDAFPTSLTDAGERFRDAATTITNQISDVRSEIASFRERNHIRIALPYSLAATRFTSWWKNWSPDQSLSCSLELGNVHDTVSALMAGMVDLVICYQQAEQHIPIDEERYDKILIDTEIVKPYASRVQVESGHLQLPGTPQKPVPLLMYSPTVYFARVVETAMKKVPDKISGKRVFEAEMSDVLGDLASSGLGIAWLADSLFQSRRGWDLVALGNGKWDIEVSIYAYKAKVNQRMSIKHLWQRIHCCKD
jgi:LysR family transcriptional regulator, hypochlorite-specific transcription factor HypT